MIQRLIRIWGGVKLLSNNETIFVTKIADDGKIKRIKWLPPKTYTILNFFKSLLSNNRINDAKY
jgi:Ni,Fe-hydrogenase III large subunit